MRHLAAISLFANFLMPALHGAEIRVPAATAYLDPDVGGARVFRRGIARWTDPKLKVVWFGQMKQTGELHASLVLRLKAGMTSKLRLTIARQSREVVAEVRGDETVTVSFGTFMIREKGYQSFTLESLNGAGEPAGDLETLILDGPAPADAHFNLKPRRNAASVHLFYPLPPDTEVSAFYCEMTGLEDPLWTYYLISLKE